MTNANATYAAQIEEMLLAIRANIEYLKTNGSSQVRIKNGKLIDVLEDGFVYDFELGWVQDIDEDADIEVKVGQQNVSGKVAAVTDANVRVILDSHLGDDVPSATLIISSYYLLERLCEHLEGVKSGELEHSSIAEKTLKLEPAVVELDEGYELNDPDMNPSQKKAIQLALGSDVTYIWGPPGTGKSETIARLVEALIERDMSILLISHTNAATDSVLLKAVEWFEKQSHPDYLDGKFLRVGSLKAIADELKGKMVIPETIMEEKARPLREEIEKITAEMESISRRIEMSVMVEAKHASYAKVTDGLKQGRAYLEKNQAEVEAQDAGLAQERHKLSDVEARIRAFQAKGTLSRFVSGTNLEKLSGEKAQYLRAADRYEQKMAALKEQEQRANAKISELNGKADAIQRELKLLGDVLGASELQEYKKRIKGLAEQRDALQGQIDGLGDSLIADAKVIATTLTKSYMSKPILSRKYDCVILDEASMAPLPAVASAAGLAQRKMIVVGDFFQLAPIAKHRVDTKNKTDEEADEEQRLVDKWLKRDIFNLVGIDSAIRHKHKPDAWLTQLDTQYRMHPEISALVNKLVYAPTGFQLHDGEKTAENGLKLLAAQPLPGTHLGIYDTHAMGALPVKSDSGSWYNLTHALVLVELAKQAIASGYDKIGIISAYRAQINLIQRILKDDLPSADFEKVRADTVHRFQGGAKEIIIFDVTVPYTDTMYDDAKDGGDDEKLINVAFSRAKEKCIIVADVATVMAKHSSSSLIKAAITYCGANNHPVIDAEPLLAKYGADDRTEHWLASLANVEELEKEIENAKLFSQADFYPNFIRDLLSAEHEVIIQSAFITSNRSNVLKPIFQQLQKKGVRVFILTRVPWEHEGNMRVEAEYELKVFEKMGLTVLPFLGKIHQKYAIIDRNILWDGSLNILSQRDSQETMRRYVGPQAVQQYMGFQRLDKNIGVMGENNLKHCEVCEEPGAWYWTKKVRGQMWTFCLIGNHSHGKPPKTAADRTAREQEKEVQKEKAAKVRQQIKQNDKGELICPVHDRVLQEKMHPLYGQYWTCPNVKECACTINPSQLARLKAGKL